MKIERQRRLRPNAAPRFALGVALCASALCGWGDGAIASETAIVTSSDRAELLERLSRHGITAASLQALPVPASPEDPATRLGAALFFTLELSGAGDTACASCHHPRLGGADALPLSIGTQAVEPRRVGPGRMHSYDTLGLAPRASRTPRNAPTTFNVGLYQEALFYDGRLQSLESGGVKSPSSFAGYADPHVGTDLLAAQAMLPVVSVTKMQGSHPFSRASDHVSVREELANRIDGSAAWRALFCETVGRCDDAPLRYLEISDALATYQRSQQFIDNPLYRFVAMAGAAGAVEGGLPLTPLSDEAVSGALLFFGTEAEGGLGCASCHTGINLSDERFHRAGFTQSGPGKGDGIGGREDWGRQRVTGEASDIGKFRTPSLLNVALTAPYGHAGNEPTLADVLARHRGAVNVRPLTHRQMVDAQQGAADSVTEAIEALAMPPEPLPDTVERDLLAFLEALSDPCAASPDCVSRWEPNTALLSTPGLRLLDAELEPGR